MKSIVFVGMAILALVQLSGCTPLGVVVGGAAAAGLVAVEERSVEDAVKDAGIKVSIIDALFQESESLFVDVSTTVIEGRVLVTGEVPTEEDRITATRLIWQVKGVQQVLNELQVSNKETVSSTAGDSWITTKLKGRLIQDLDVKHVNYAIDTVNRVVYLFGIAQDQKELDRVYLHARDISGVRKIINHVVMKDSRKTK
ncbi:BON domain-containing protein [Sneathiella sp.]|jgi:osmotically-inducible protein OsmY|uniref:BON domain-containing protein n=1 Tax=Sneathiella sp. TaxID=1964365 RepID=UPI0039E69A5E